jgi:hypothetical protein
MTDEQKVREAFEAWLLDRHVVTNPARYPRSGIYVVEWIDSMWEGWQAAVAWMGGEGEPFCFVPSHLFESINSNIRLGRDAVLTAYTKRHDPSDVLLYTRPPRADADARDVKCDDVLVPFVHLMARELHANAGKGDRPGWLKMSASDCLLEIYYHSAKLQKAVKDGEGDRISEYAADVANMAMMLLDICGGLDVRAPSHRPSPCG